MDTKAAVCSRTGGELEQIRLLLHASVQTTDATWERNRIWCTRRTMG